ncbi:hypothetical protein HYT05_02910 [Candidatus Kaiserbacteria bacterium]|nr:hypothetical protein [Candidatus Kaiserbacteria bacterium]
MRKIIHSGLRSIALCLAVVAILVAKPAISDEGKYDPLPPAQKVEKETLNDALYKNSPEQVIDRTYKSRLAVCSNLEDVLQLISALRDEVPDDGTAKMDALYQSLSNENKCFGLESAVYTVVKIIVTEQNIDARQNTQLIRATIGIAELRVHGFDKALYRIVMLPGESM